MLNCNALPAHSIIISRHQQIIIFMKFEVILPQIRLNIKYCPVLKMEQMSITRLLSYKLNI